MRYTTITFIVEGDPIPQKRHRTYMRGNRMCTFDPQSKEKAIIKNALSQAFFEMQNSLDKETALKASYLTYSDRYHVDLTFYMPIPKSFNRGDYNESLWNIEIPTHCDIDNLIKFILDCGNEILYPDDRKIVNITAKKLYSKHPRTEMKITGEKLNIGEDVKKILSIYGTDELYSLLTDINEFFYLFDVEQREQWLCDEIEEFYSEDFSEARKVRTAQLLSRLADHHSKLLKKINDSCPEFWRKNENMPTNS